MVVDGDAQGAAGLDDLAGHVDVGGRWRRVARRMVVYQDHGAGRQLERAAHDLARIDRRVIDGAAVQGLVGDELVFLVMVAGI